MTWEELILLILSVLLHEHATPLYMFNYSFMSLGNTL